MMGKEERQDAGRHLECTGFRVGWFRALYQPFVSMISAGHGTAVLPFCFRRQHGVTSAVVISKKVMKYAWLL